MFNIATICINLQQSWLGMDNLEMLISIYKNWLYDAHLGGFSSMEKFMQREETLMNENEGSLHHLGSWSWMNPTLRFRYAFIFCFLHISNFLFPQSTLNLDHNFRGSQFFKLVI
jgi:hypothetical protein